MFSFAYRELCKTLMSKWLEKLARTSIESDRICSKEEVISASLRSLGGHYLDTTKGTNGFRETLVPRVLWRQLELAM